MIPRLFVTSGIEKWGKEEYEKKAEAPCPITTLLSYVRFYSKTTKKADKILFRL